MNLKVNEMNTYNNLDPKDKNMFLDRLVRRFFMIVFSLLFVAAVISSTLVVQEDELVIVKQFGDIKRIIDKPGLYFKLPIIQNTDTLTKKLSNNEFQPIKIFTKDKKSLMVKSYAIWKITEPHNFINNVETMDNLEIIIEDAVYSASRQRLSALSYDEIINGIASGKDYNEDITIDVKTQMENMGINILDVRLMRTDLTSENEESAYENIRTEREKIAKQYLSIGEKKASQIKAEADKNAKIIISKAYAASEEIRGKADAEAAKIYAKSYNKDPEFYRFMRTIESYKITLKDKPTIVIPIDSPYTKYLIGK